MPNFFEDELRTVITIDFGSAQPCRMNRIEVEQIPWFNRNERVKSAAGTAISNSFELTQDLIWRFTKSCSWPELERKVALEIRRLLAEFGGEDVDDLGISFSWKLRLLRPEITVSLDENRNSPTEFLTFQNINSAAIAEISANGRILFSPIRAHRKLNIVLKTNQEAFVDVVQLVRDGVIVSSQVCDH